MNRLEGLWALTIASTKMYFRNFTAIFFTLVFPVIFLVVFGFINSNENIKLDIAYFNNSDSELSQQFDEVVQDLAVDPESTDDQDDKILAFDEEVTSLEAAKEKLTDGDLTAIVVVPESFGEFNELGIPNGEIELIYDQSNQSFQGIVESVFNDILGEFNAKANELITGQPPVEIFSIQSEGVQSSELTAIDYLVPGIIGFSIMSLGVFSITEGFIQLKTNGSLRRLKVAPINPIDFLAAQSITRVLMTIINVVTMLGLSIMLFDFNMQGSYAEFLFVSTLGIVLFLGFGYAIAGWAKDGNQAAPISNIIFFPMMFLSGTFFPREAFPDWLIPITDFMPLTYLADALREIANNAAPLTDLGPELLGMAVWILIIYGVAVKLFRWE